MSQCKVCGCDFGCLHEVREMMNGTRDKFPYFECANCGCVSLAQIPENLPHYYDSAYYSFKEQPPSQVGLAIYRLSMSRLSSLTRLLPFPLLKMLHHLHLCPKMKLLDVGCGTGTMIRALRALDYSAEGIDPFISSDIRDKWGIRVRKAGLSELSQKVDVILFLHSLEHMPLDSLALARDLLNPDGLCVVRIPVANWAWRRYGTNWVQLDAPRHFFVHTVKSFHLLAEKSGFKVEKTIFDSTDLQFWGSSAYARDIPLRETRPSLAERAILRLCAIALNFRSLGDQAQFYLRPVK